MVIVGRIKGKIFRTVLCCTVLCTITTVWCVLHLCTVICDDVNYDDDDDDDVHSQSHMSSSNDQVQTLCVRACVFS